jgi:hypothetical protein
MARPVARPTIDLCQSNGISVSQWPDDHRMNEALPHIVRAVFPTLVGVTVAGEAPNHLL